MNKPLFLIFLFLQILVSCDEGQESTEGDMVVTDQALANQLKSNPER